MQSTSGFQGVDRVIKVIDVVQEAAPITLAGIARAASLSEPTTLRYVSALRRHRIVQRDDLSGTYSLGPKLISWGESAQESYDPRKLVGPFLDRLSAQFKETVELAAHSGDHRVVVLDARPGWHGVSRVTQVGEIEDWHATSVGKALLAAMPPSTVATILGNETLQRYTAKTRATLPELERDLSQVRERGYALDDEESEIGLRCVGVSVLSATNEPLFAISVSGPTYRVTEETVPKIAEALLDVKRELERSWRHHRSTNGKEQQHA